MAQERCVRPLGNYERYSLAEDNTGHPQLVTYVATYPSEADIPPIDVLRSRARKLVEDFPLLGGRVVDGRTTSPKWEVLSGEAVERGIENLVSDKTLMDLASPDVDGVISSELLEAQSLRVTSEGFLWRVVRYLPQYEVGPSFVAMTINHVISDGNSSLVLFNALLAAGTVTIDSAATVFAPTMEDTINCRPGLLYMLKVVWRELLVPKLPGFLSRILGQTPCWPGRAPSTVGQRQTFKHISLTAQQLTSLKTLGKANQVKTLHPILEMAAVVALWQTFSAAEIAFDSPMSVRNAARGHPLISGNYIANVEFRVSCSSNGIERFWDKAREFATWLSSERGRRQARSAMGMLAYVPDGENMVTPDSPAPTGWETFLLDKSTRPPSSSLEVSNLGYTELPPRASSIAFAQTPSPFIAPMVINALGHGSGLDAVVCWREGAFVDETKHMLDFAETYRAVLVHLAELDTDSASRDIGSLTFRDVKEAVTAHV